MPLYWGDYARDTGHLNNAGHGSYMMLIKHYWCTGAALYDDDDELWRVACCDSKRAWMKLRPKLMRFFTARDGKLYHKRVDAELAKARSIVERKAEAGKKGAEKRWQKDGTPNGGAIAEPPSSQCQTDAHARASSPSQPHKKERDPGGSPKKPPPRIDMLGYEWTQEDVQYVIDQGLDVDEMKLRVEVWAENVTKAKRMKVSPSKFLQVWALDDAKKARNKARLDPYATGNPDRSPERYLAPKDSVWASQSRGVVTFRNREGDWEAPFPPDGKTKAKLKKPVEVGR